MLRVRVFLRVRAWVRFWVRVRNMVIAYELQNELAILNQNLHY